MKNTNIPVLIALIIITLATVKTIRTFYNNSISSMNQTFYWYDQDKKDVESQVKFEQKIYKILCKMHPEGMTVIDKNRKHKLTYGFRRGEEYVDFIVACSLDGFANSSENFIVDVTE